MHIYFLNLIELTFQRYFTSLAQFSDAEFIYYKIEQLKLNHRKNSILSLLILLNLLF
jgi:hypothetical protein